MNWRVRLIMAADWIDHRVLQHRAHRLCHAIAWSPFWSLATDEQGKRHRRRLGLPRDQDQIEAS